MATQKALFLVGMAFLLSAFGAVSSLALSLNNVNLQEQQTVTVAASPFVPQVNGENSCFSGGCHQEFDFKDTDSIHKPFTEKRCSECHFPDPHRQRDNWSTADELALCYACHPVESLGYSHPMGENVVDPNTGRDITCITCHSPHYANHSYQLVLDGRGELCVHCHVEFLSGNP